METLPLLYAFCLKQKTAANQRKTAYSGCFGTPGETRTHYIPLRRRTLYPGEVRGLIQQIFNFRAQQDSNELPLRRGLLYPFNYGGRCTGAAAEPSCILYPIPPILSMRHKNFSGFCGVFSPSAVAICVFSGYNKKLCFERMWKCPHRADALRGPHFDLDRAK